VKDVDGKIADGKHNNHHYQHMNDFLDLSGELLVQKVVTDG